MIKVYEDYNIRFDEAHAESQKTSFSKEPVENADLCKPV